MSLAPSQEAELFRQTLEERFHACFADWPQFLQQFSRETLKEGAHWVRAGDRCSDFLLISAGLLRVYLIDQQGREITEGFYEPGMLLGPLVSMVGEGDRPCPFHVQAMAPSTLWVSNYPRFHRYAMDKPDVLNFEIAFLQDLFVRNAKRDAKRLMSNGEARYRWFLSKYSHLLDRVPLCQIASFLGMTPVSLSRLRKRVGTGLHEAQMTSAKRVA